MIIGDALLQFSRLLHPDRNLTRYQNKLGKLAAKAKAYHKNLLQQGAPDDVGAVLASLKHVIEIEADIASRQVSDELSLESLSLIGALDGVAAHEGVLAAIYSDVAIRTGWDVQLMSLPSLFLMRAAYKGQVILFDPAQGCLALQAHSVRDMLKAEIAPDIELSNDFFESLARKDAVVSTQNALKLFLIGREDYTLALDLVRAMLALVPAEYRLLLDVGILYARTQQTEAAIFALRGYIEKAPESKTRQEAQDLLNDLLTMVK